MESVINNEIVISSNILIWFGELIYLILSLGHLFRTFFVFFKNDQVTNYLDMMIFSKKDFVGPQEA